MDTPHEREPPSTDDRTDNKVIVVDARQILQGRKEVWIEHDGVRYRLRVTRRNKLILQK
jgi:hemin uptake protein HemP